MKCTSHLQVLPMLNDTLAFCWRDNRATDGVTDQKTPHGRSSMVLEK